MRYDYSNNDSIRDTNGQCKQTLITNEAWYRICEHFSQIPVDELTNDDVVIINYIADKLQRQVDHDKYTVLHADIKKKAIDDNNGKAAKLYEQIERQISARRQYIQVFNARVLGNEG